MGTNFRKSRFFFVHGLQPVVVGWLGSKWAWSSVWGDSNDEWKCCQTPTLNLIWKVDKRTLYRTQERRNRWDFPFISKWRKTSRGKIAAVKKATGEERSEIKGQWGYVAKLKIKKGWPQENYCTWIIYIFRRSALILFKSNFWVFQGRKNRKILAFRYFFAGNNFRESDLTECFAGI